jgi:hypothetical protein
MAFTVTVTPTIPGQRARLTFDGVAGQYMNLGLTAVTIASSTVSFLNPDGTTLAAITMGTNPGDLDTPVLPVTGTYKILVEPGGTYTGSMTLTLSAALTGTLSPTDPPTTLTLRPGQDVRMTFEGSVNDWVSVGINNISTSLAPDCFGNPTYLTLTILKPDGTTLGTTAMCNKAGDLDVQLPATGTYTVLVKTVQGRAGMLTLTLSTAVLGGLVVNGAAVLVSVSRPGQDGRLTFDGAEAQQVTVHVTANTAGCTNVTLLKPNGTSATNTSSCASSFNLATQTLPETGTYTVAADPGINTGSLTLSVTSP